MSLEDTSFGKSVFKKEGAIYSHLSMLVVLSWLDNYILITVDGSFLNRKLSIVNLG